MTVAMMIIMMSRTARNRMRLGSRFRSSCVYLRVRVLGAEDVTSHPTLKFLISFDKEFALPNYLRELSPRTLVF